MPLRVRLVGIKTPHNVIRTFHRNIVLNASELCHQLPSEHLKTMFSYGAGINFDFLNRGQVILRPEEQIVAYLNGEPMLACRDYSLFAEDVRILSIKDTHFHVNVFQSYF